MSQNLIWIDLEMTGLNTQTDHIIEIATLITDPYLKILAEGPSLAITQPESILENLDTWNKKQHTKSGLLNRVREAGVSLEYAESATLNFIKPYVPACVSPMCGNSICQDRRFLYREMPKLEAFFHYRNLDVSTLKELAIRWNPALPKFNKKQAHRALEDIKDSIEELKYYREYLFK